MTHIGNRPLGTATRMLVLLALGACSSPAPAPPRAQGNSAGNASAAGTGGAADAGVIMEMPLCAPDNPFCAPAMPTMTGDGSPAMPNTMNCGSLPIDLTPAGVNIMIAVDGSASMMTHWPDVVTAVKSLRQNNPSAAFGMHLFWADAVDPLTDTSTMNTTNNACLEEHHQTLELGDHSADELVSFMGGMPQGGTIAGVYQVAPVVDAIDRYLTQPTALADPKRTNYLVLITSANDNCFGSAYVGKADKLVAYQKLAVELGKKNIRVIPVGVDAPSTTDAAADDPFGFGPGLTGTSMAANGTDLVTDYDALNTLLKYGGSGLSEVPRIDTPAKLQELVSRVGQTLNNCRFDIPATLDANNSVNAFELSFSINGTPVPRDRHQTNGWDFVNGSTSTVEFFGQGCQALQSGQSLQANKSCEQNVCGTAAVSVATKPRMMLLLLDSSASRIECSDGSQDCLSTPGTPGRSLTYWEVVQNAVEQALISPVNDDVMFGMQFFPTKNSESLSCEISAAPEIPPAPGQQIAVMKGMLEKLPFGFSPVVGVMESVAAAPGKLADPGVLGTVVMLSDGGDNCSGDEQPQIVSRLGAAAKKLLDAGVKTYAIRYGSADGETPEAAEQLNAIVNNGGTAQTGKPAAYIDAKSADELGQALAGISDMLATCSFTLNDVPASVDKNRTSLYLNGEQIGFDAMNTRADGWQWTDATQTGIQLYGAACTAFKTNRHTSVVAEFGCEPVIIKGPD
jgi:hypothetical protein